MPRDYRKSPLTVFKEFNKVVEDFSYEVDLLEEVEKARKEFKDYIKSEKNIDKIEYKKSILSRRLADKRDWDTFDSSIFDENGDKVPA